MLDLREVPRGTRFAGLSGLVRVGSGRVHECSLPCGQGDGQPALSGAGRLRTVMNEMETETAQPSVQGRDLDRVLRDEADESLVTGQGCRESEKGQVVAGLPLVTRAESAVASPEIVRSITHLRWPNRLPTASRQGYSLFRRPAAVPVAPGSAAWRSPTARPARSSSTSAAHTGSTSASPRRRRSRTSSRYVSGTAYLRTGDFRNGSLTASPSPYALAMTARAHPSPTSDEVIHALERTGYLLEQRVAKVVKNSGFYTGTGRAFKDPDEGKSREVDVYAFKEFFANEAGNITLGVKLLVECKNSSGPYVVLGRKPDDNERNIPPYSHTLPVEEVKWVSRREGARRYLKSRKTWNWLGLQELPHSPSRDDKRGLQLVRMNLKNKEWQADNASIFDSLTLPLMKAVEAFRPIRDTGHTVPEWAYMHLCFPLVVTSGELFYVDADEEVPSAQAVDWAPIHRHIDMEGMKGVFSMDIVRFDGLENYIAERVLAFCREVSSIVRADPEKLRMREVPNPE